MLPSFILFPLHINLSFALHTMFMTLTQSTLDLPTLPAAAAFGEEVQCHILSDAVERQSQS